MRIDLSQRIRRIAIGLVSTHVATAAELFAIATEVETLERDARKAIRVLDETFANAREDADLASRSTKVVPLRR